MNAALLSSVSWPALRLGMRAYLRVWYRVTPALPTGTTLTLSDGSTLDGSLING